MSLAKPPLEIDAWSCLQWNATKTIKSFFWGSTDTTSGKIIHAVSPRECILAAQPPFLCGNQHTETDGKTIKFVAEPKGDGIWMKTIQYSILNCLTKKIKLIRDCDTCQLMSPMGPLNASLSDQYAIINDITIIWSPPEIRQTNCKKYEMLSFGSANLTDTDSAGRLVDEKQQIEVQFDKIQVPSLDNCDKTMKVYENIHEVLGIPDTFISFTSSKPKRKQRSPKKQENLEDPPITTTIKPQSKQQQQPQIKPTVRIENYLTKQAAETLFLEQRQFVEGRLTDQSNVLAHEVRQLYCMVNRMHRNLVAVLAQWSGLIAARSLNLDTCDQIKAEGEGLVLQTCAKKVMEVSVKDGRCGPQPVIIDEYNKTYSLAKNGWSLVPYTECLWQTPFITMNAKIYMFKDNNWSECKPKIHISNLKLIAKFDVLLLHQYDIASHYHELYKYLSMDPMTMLALQMGTMHYSEADGMMEVYHLPSKRSTPEKVEHVLTWMDYIRYGLLGLAIFVVTGILVKIFVMFNPIPGIRKLWTSFFPHRRDEDNESIVYYQANPPAVRHDHSDTVFIPGRGVFFKDMCPINDS